jgi:HK97 family phage major capsid protein
MLKELREKLRARLAEARAIIAKAKTDNRGLTQQETDQYQAALDAVEVIKTELRAAEDAERIRLEAEIESMAPETQAVAPDTAQRQEQRQRETRQYADPGVETITRNHERYEAGDALGALVSARFRFGQDRTAALRWADRAYGSGSMQVRAMQQSVFTAGGATIGENFVGQELIEFLRATAAVRRAGARDIPLINGSATLPKVTGGASAYWGAEGDNITPSELTTGEVKLVEKKLTALCPVSNDLLRNSNLAIDRMIRDDVGRAAANAEDAAFLKGDGVGSKPKGIYYWVGAAGRGNSAGTSLANSRTDIAAALNRLGNANAPLVRRAWFMHSRSQNYAGWQLVDTNGNFAYPSLQAPAGGSLAGAPVFPNNNIAITLGGGTASEIYYAEMTECFIGDSGALELELFANATYVDSGGQTRSGVSRDESVVRLIRKVDFGMRHSESAYVLENVLWI